MSSTTSDVLVSAFLQGLMERDFFRLLIKKPLENFDVLLSRTVKYVHVEEAKSADKKYMDVSHHSMSTRNTPFIIRPDRRPLP